jgi:hypothetical protein
MATESSVNAYVMINGNYFNIVPNSLMIVLGKGSKKVKPALNGETVSSVFFDDLSEAVGKIQFKLYNTPDNVSDMAAVQDLKNANTVQAVLTDDDNTSYTCANAAVTTDPEIEFSPESSITYVFEGDPIV